MKIDALKKIKFGYDSKGNKVISGQPKFSTSSGQKWTSDFKFPCPPPFFMSKREAAESPGFLGIRKHWLFHMNTKDATSGCPHMARAVKQIQMEASGNNHKMEALWAYH